MSGVLGEQRAGGRFAQTLAGLGTKSWGRLAQSRFARASLWSVAGMGGSQALRFVSNLVLWRLLFPEAFGVMAIVNSLLVALAMFSDVGVGAAVIQDRDGLDRTRLQTAFTIQVGRGLLLTAATWLLAEPVAAFYQQPELAPYIRVVAVTCVLQGANSMRIHTETRHVRVGRVTMITLVSQAVGTAFMIVWAALSPSVWALVIGNIVIVATKTVMSHLVLPGPRDGFAWNTDAARSLFGFGRWVFVNTLLGFAATQSDRLLFGKLVPMAALGAYSIGQALATMPDQIINRLGSGVLFPYLSQAFRDGGVDVARFRAKRRSILLLSAWMATALLVLGPPLVRFLYGPRAATAEWVVPLLALGGWVRNLRQPYSSSLLATGNARAVAAATAAKVAAMAALIPMGVFLGGFPGAVAGFSASEVAGYTASAWVVRRQGLWLWRDDARFTAAVLAVASLGLFALYLMPDLHALAQIAILGLGVTAFWGAAYAKRD